jgi:hypothetical protein
MFQAVWDISRSVALNIPWPSDTLNYVFLSMPDQLLEHDFEIYLN